MYQSTHSSSTEPIQILTFIGAGRMYFQLGVGFNNNQDIIKDMKANTGEVTIASQTFQNMNNLEEFIFPPNVLKIVVSAFLNDFKLTSISIPRPVSYIDMFCFENCVDLKTVRFENGLNQFGNQLFEGCTSLEFIIYCSADIPTNASLFPTIPLLSIKSIFMY